jgi:hypothetical protein
MKKPIAMLRYHNEETNGCEEVDFDAMKFAGCKVG